MAGIYVIYMKDLQTKMNEVFSTAVTRVSYSTVWDHSRLGALTKTASHGRVEFGVCQVCFAVWCLEKDAHKIIQNQFCVWLAAGSKKHGSILFQWVGCDFPQQACKDASSKMEEEWVGPDSSCCHHGLISGGTTWAVRTLDHAVGPKKQKILYTQTHNKRSP